MAKSKIKVSMPSGIRNKLLAATSMLLVSCVMMISSTYAWFTLSTAPEVKNISTTVAGNGSLEIALMPTSGALGDISTGYASNLNGGTTAATTANTTWGNIVQLQDATYGLSMINLYPANLEMSDTNQLTLETPVYGADGRVSETTTAAVAPGKFSEGKFIAIAAGETAYGVRSLGITEAATSTYSTYGYVVDLAVRLNTTNGANAGKLLLQTEATQRIDGSTNTETMGGGSYMQFTSVQSGIDLKSLLDAIRVTFVSNYGNGASTTYTELGTARLDTTGIAAGVSTATSTGKLALNLYTGDVKSTDNTLISALPKNQATQISAIVWLDGENLTNASVAATAAQSMSGTLNLQFATDVTLNPAKNSSLMNP